MKTTKYVIENSGISAKLIRSIARQLGGTACMPEVCNHGADCGFTGFTYHKDTVAFYRRNRSDIIDLLKTQRSDFGYSSIAEMIMSFNCLKNQDITEDEIGLTLYGQPSQIDTNIANALAWYALEVVSQAFCD